MSPTARPARRPRALALLLLALGAVLGPLAGAAPSAQGAGLPLNQAATPVLGRAPQTAPPPTTPTLRVHYDTGFGSSISIRGSQPPLTWSAGVAAQWTDGNVWVWEGPAGMGTFEFKPLIDDAVWSTGGNYEAPGGVGVVDVYPFFGPSKGTLQIVSGFYSPQLQNTRSLRIYLPPSYFENGAKHYPVLYMHDGQNLFDPSSSAFGVEWMVDESLDHHVGIGEVREVIVVGVDNTPQRIYEYTPVADPKWGGGGGELYLSFLRDTVKPFVDHAYRTLDEPEHTLLGGSSLGGLISFYGSWDQSGTFGAAICMSSSFWWNGEGMTWRVKAQGERLPPAVFYLDSGGPSDGAAQTFHMRDTLHRKGYEFGLNLFHWYDPFGQHNESSWAARFPIALKYLLAWE